MSAELQPCGRFEWERIVRRIPISKAFTVRLKLLAATLAQYADPNGSRIRPGVERLANVTGVAEVSVKRQLKVLREMGLIEQVARGGGPSKQAATYRLTIPADLLERVEMLDPDERTRLIPKVSRVVEDSAGPEVELVSLMDELSSDPQIEELRSSETELVSFEGRTRLIDPPLTSDVETHHPTYLPATTTQTSLVPSGTSARDPNGEPDDRFEPPAKPSKWQPAGTKIPDGFRARIRRPSAS